MNASIQNGFKLTFTIQMKEAKDTDHVKNYKWKAVIETSPQSFNKSTKGELREFNTSLSNIGTWQRDDLATVFTVSFSQRVELRL